MYSPEEVAVNLQKLLTSKADSQAPVKRTQTKLRSQPYISNETRKITRRDLLKKTAINSKNPIDWLLFHKTRNKVVKLLRIDKVNYLHKSMDITLVSSKKVWINVKCQLVWPVATSPKLLTDVVNLVTSPVGIANLINTTQIGRINKISSEIQQIEEKYPY